MAKNAYLIIMAILIIGILTSGAACVPWKKKTTKEVEEPGTAELRNIRTGTEGLSMEFVANIPPDQIYDSETLTVMVNLKNKGAENIEEANFFIGGIDPGIVDFGSASREGVGLGYSDIGVDYIPGKDELRGEEGEAMLNFKGAMARGGLPQGTDVYEPEVVVTACYDYRTIANPIVCIDANPFGVYTAAKACEPKTVTDEGGQGAPIAVTKVEQVPSRGRVQFKIYVENKGGGKAISNDKFLECNRINPTDYKYVNLIDKYKVSISDTAAVCQPDWDNLRLIDEKGVMICSFDGLDQTVPAYTTPLSIELLYNYMKSTQPKKVRILHIAN